MKMEKATLGFRIIFKRFAGTFCQAQSLKLGGVNRYTNVLLTMYALEKRYLGKLKK